MKEALLALKAKEDYHREEAKKYYEAIKALKACCNHKWKYDGHGHNYDVYICTVCGEEKEE